MATDFPTFDTPPSAYAVGEILVQFAPGVSASARLDALALASAASRGQVVETLVGDLADGDNPSLVRMTLGKGVSVEQAIQALSHRPGIEFAEPNWTYSTQAASNDPAYTGGSLWGMYGDQTAPGNQYGSQAGEAWAGNYVGSTQSVVGVIDTGIDYTHPDLYLNIWLNQGEIRSLSFFQDLVDIDGDNLITFRDLNDAGNSAYVADLNQNGRIDAGDLLNDSRWENGQDDDGNGYRDDLVGWDFVNNDNDPYDDHNHGTHVSGTIGGIGGNGAGVAGVNWNVQLMGLKFLSATGSGSTANAVKAVDYYTNASKAAEAAGSSEQFAATNNSWGGGGFSQSLLDAIVRGAYEDVLFVAAAGNGGNDGVGDNNDSTANYPSNYNTTTTASANYPATGYDAVIAVAALTSSGGLASFSNYGATTVDLAAPGVSIYSTVRGGGYATYSGTSMATPHVTGALALYLAANPDATAEQLRDALLSTTASTSSLSGKTVTGGRLDIGSLIAASIGPQPDNPAVESIVLADTSLKAGESTTVTFTFSEAVTGFDAADIDLTNANGGSIVGLTSGDQVVWTATFTPAANVEDNSNTIKVAAGSYNASASGLPGGAGTSANFAIDTKAPSVVITLSDDALTAGETATVTFQFSETVIGFNSDDVDLSQAVGSLGSLSSSDNRTFTAVFTPASNTVDSTNLISVAAGYTDLAENSGAVGSSGNFSIDTTVQAGEILYGTTGKDTIVGTAGPDVLCGVPQSGTNLGKGTVDRLTGLDGADLFILGDSRGRFYDDGNKTNAGTKDYALITDFSAADGDHIQLAAGRHFLRDVTVGGVTGAGVYYDSNSSGAWDSRDELIGLVGGVQAGNLDLNVDFVVA